MKKWFFKCVIYGLMLCCLPVWADDVVRQSGESVTNLDTVVVTAGRIEESKEDVTTNITVIDEDEIRQSAVQDLGDLLAERGFMIIEYPNSLISVGIRGFRTQTQGNDLSGHVLILINGRRAGTGNLGEILTDNVERVEIIRGPGAVQYGSSAMGGVINVITKQGKDRPEFSLMQTLGSWDYRKTTADASGEIGNFDFSISGSIESQDDYSIADGDTYYNTGFDSKERINVNTGWTFTPGNRVGISYASYEGEEIGSPDYLSQNDLDDHVCNSVDNFDLTYTGRTEDDFLLWSLRYFKTKGEYNNYDPTLYGNAPLYKRNTDQQGGQAQITVNSNYFKVTGGIDWAYYEIRDTYTTDDNVYDNPAAFLLAKMNLLDEKLILSAGLRYDQYDVEADDGRSVR